MAKNKTPSEFTSVPVRMPSELDELITSTAAEIKLSKQDTIRLSIERGVKILKSQLTGDPAPAMAA